MRFSKSLDSENGLREVGCKKLERDSLQAHKERILARYAKNDYVIIVNLSKDCKQNSEIFRNLISRTNATRICKVIFVFYHAQDCENFLKIIKDLAFLDFLSFAQKKCVKIELCAQIRKLDSEILQSLQDFSHFENLSFFLFKKEC